MFARMKAILGPVATTIGQSMRPVFQDDENKPRVSWEIEPIFHGFDEALSFRVVHTPVTPVTLVQLIGSSDSAPSSPVVSPRTPRLARIIDPSFGGFDLADIAPFGRPYTPPKPLSPVSAAIPMASSLLGAAHLNEMTSEDAGIAAVADAVSASEVAAVEASGVAKFSLSKEMGSAEAVTRGLVISATVSGVTNKRDLRNARHVTDTPMQEVPQAKNIAQRILQSVSPGPGYGASFLSSLAKTGAIFIVNPYIESAMRKRGASDEHIRKYGFSIAGAVVGVMTTPFAVAKLYKHISDKSTGQIWAGLFSTPQARKVLGTAARYEVPKSGIFWLLFPGFIAQGQAYFAESIQKLSQSQSAPDREWAKVLQYSLVSGMVTFCISAGSGVAAATVTYPLDVIQKILQKNPEKDGIALFQEEFAKHGKDMVSQFLYKGFGNVAVRMLLGMGAMGVAVKGADWTYANVVVPVSQIASEGLERDPRFPMRGFR